MDLREVARQFSRDMKRRGLLPSTIDKRNRALRLLAQVVDPWQASAEDIEDWLDSRRLGDRARYGYISHLHAFYLWAIRRGYTDRDPTAVIERPKLRQGLPRPMSDGDLAMALEAAPSMIRTWIVLAAFAGLRCGEIAALDRDGVLDTLQSPMLRVVGKGQKERLIPAHPMVVDALRVYGLPRSGPVFVSPTSGRPFTPCRVSQLLNRYLHDIGITSTAHQLRHWFGTQTYASCHDLRVVQELLGHSSPTTTAIYTAFSRPEARRTVLDLAPPGEASTRAAQIVGRELDGPHPNP